MGFQRDSRAVAADVRGGDVDVDSINSNRQFRERYVGKMAHSQRHK
jgi:hypothetical protein